MPVSRREFLVRSGVVVAGTAVSAAVNRRERGTFGGIGRGCRVADAGVGCGRQVETAAQTAFPAR